MIKKRFQIRKNVSKLYAWSYLQDFMVCHTWKIVIVSFVLPGYWIDMLDSEILFKQLS